MALTTAQRTALATEINTDPKALGYSPGTKTNAQITTIINTAGASSETIDSGVVQGHQIVGAIVQADYALLSAAQVSQLTIWLSPPFVDTSSANVRAVFAALFGAGTQTRTNLQALTQRAASRAEILFGRGTVVLVEDVSAALARTV